MATTKKNSSHRKDSVNDVCVYFKEKNILGMWESWCEITPN